MTAEPLRVKLRKKPGEFDPSRFRITLDRALASKRPGYGVPVAPPRPLADVPLAQSPSARPKDPTA